MGQGCNIVVAAKTTAEQPTLPGRGIFGFPNHCYLVGEKRLPSCEIIQKGPGGPESIAMKCARNLNIYELLTNYILNLLALFSPILTGHASGCDM